MKAKIYKPTKNAMQSGKRDVWVLEYEPAKKKYVEPLMGWTGSSDMNQQINLNFDSKEEAIEYAQKKEIEFSVVEPKVRKQIKKSYAANFAYKAD